MNIETVIKAIEREIGSDKIIMTPKGDKVMIVLLSDAYSNLQYLEVVKMRLRTRGLRMIPMRKVADSIFVFTVAFRERGKTTSI